MVVCASGAWGNCELDVREAAREAGAEGYSFHAQPPPFPAGSKWAPWADVYACLETPPQCRWVCLAALASCFNRFICGGAVAASWPAAHHWQLGARAQHSTAHVVCRRSRRGAGRCGCASRSKSFRCSSAAGPGAGGLLPRTARAQRTGRLCVGSYKGRRREVTAEPLEERTARHALAHCTRLPAG